MMDIAAIAARKAAFRTQALAQRDALPAAQRQAAAAFIARRGLPLDLRSGSIVSGFVPIRSEISPLPLMHALETAGASLALPVVAGRDRPLVMRQWRFGDPLTDAAFGLREPPSSAAEVLPDYLIVPLAAFDRFGHRIGYGAGYYDRTIASLRARKPIVAVGIAFAVQEIASVPATTHDERLDLVVTEGEIIDCRAS